MLHLVNVVAVVVYIYDFGVESQTSREWRNKKRSLFLFFYDVAYQKEDKLNIK